MKRVFFYILSCIFIFAVIVYFKYIPQISFISKSIHLSLNKEVEPYSYIRNTRNIDMNKLHVENNVNNQKVGQYILKYKYENHSFDLKVFIEDQTPPQFEVKNEKILIHSELNPKELVTNIIDDSPTKVYFNKNYKFDEQKTYRVEVVVEDKYHNKAMKNTYVLVEREDVDAPVLTGLYNMELLVGDDIDYYQDVKIYDNYDKKPKMTIDDSNVCLDQIGKYKVYYNVQDASGNKMRYSRLVNVKSRYDNREALHDGKKICYLTFDDGPSSHTKDVLRILKKYKIHATFFVTGTCPQYFSYIKEAHEQGHTIGLHSYSHDYEYIYTSQKNYLQDLRKIRDVVYKQTGIYTPYIRFPGGSSNMVSKRYNEGIMKGLTHKVIDLGYQYYDWNCVNGDGEGIKDCNGLKKKALSEIGEQEDIMFLMHDSELCENTIKVLPDIIEELMKRGFIFEAICKDTPTFHHTVQN